MRLDLVQVRRAQALGSRRDMRPLREDEVSAYAALREAREALRDADEAVWFACFVVSVLVRQRQEEPHDAAAERRVLGAMLLGRATAEDVTGLCASDFIAPGHRELFAVLSAAAEVWPLPPGQPRRAALVPRVRRVLRMLPGGGAEARAVSLPWPAKCPREEIATVRGLARWRRVLAVWLNTGRWPE